MDDGAKPHQGILKELLQKIKNLCSDDVTEEEIISMVNEGHEQGVLLESEAEMIHNIFEFGDKEAKDIMIHRKNMAALDGEMTLNEAVRFIVDNQYSRFPVYQDNIDNIIGVLHIKEALSYSLNPAIHNTPIKDITGLIRDVDFIPETRNINILFKEMQSAKNHMVIVVDEYGQTAGLVAMEDILEEIVGNILDEHDEEDILIEQLSDESYIMSGMAPLEDVAEILEMEVNTEDYDTLNGFLISLIDKIPNDGEVFQVSFGGYEFSIVRVENKMIKSVKVTKQKENTVTSAEDNPCQSEEKMVE